MVSRKEMFALALFEILFFYVFLSPVYEYLTCVEPEETVLEKLWIYLGLLDKQYICPSTSSLKMVMVRYSLLQLLTLLLYFLRVNIFGHQKSPVTRSVPEIQSLSESESDVTNEETLDVSLGWEYLRPHIPLSQMTDEEKEIEWKYSHLYMECVYDRVRYSDRVG